MRLLDLFCCAGGAGKGYSDAGFEVVGVDKDPQPNYPFEFIQMDAIEALDTLLAGGTIGGYRLEDFDAIHGSPPCQFFSSMTIVTGRRQDHSDLIGPTRERLEACGLPYVIENVERARVALRDPVSICGLSLGLTIVIDGKRHHLKRHRLFESSIGLLVPPCACHRYRDSGSVLGVYGGGTRQATRALAKNYNGGCTDKATAGQARVLMGMPWATRDEMNQAIPPAYTELIGHQLAQHIRMEAAA